MNKFHGINIHDRFHVLLFNKFFNLLTFYSPHEGFGFPHELCVESHNKHNFFNKKTMIKLNHIVKDLYML